MRGIISLVPREQQKLLQEMIDIDQEHVKYHVAVGVSDHRLDWLQIFLLRDVPQILSAFDQLFISAVICLAGTQINEVLSFLIIFFWRKWCLSDFPNLIKLNMKRYNHNYLLISHSLYPTLPKDCQISSVSHTLGQSFDPSPFQTFDLYLLPKTCTWLTLGSRLKMVLWCVRSSGCL